MIAELLATRGLSGPTGKPLYTYKCTDEEIDALRDFLQCHLACSPDRIGPETARAFCLWAANHWTRSHVGGQWKWATILEAIDASNRFAHRQLELQGVVRGGLRFWGREVLRGANNWLYLVTLACEGGLPLHIVAQDQGALQRYFRKLFQRYQANLIRGELAFGITPSDLAEQLAETLPQSLRQDVVYELCGRIVAVLHPLLNDVDSEADPVSSLDARNPGWRDDLPLNLDDERATDFLRGVLRDAITVVRQPVERIAWRRSLRRRVASDSSDVRQWELLGRHVLPLVLSIEELSRVFVGDLERGNHFELLVRDDAGNGARLASLTVRRGHDAEVLVERLGAASRPSAGDHVALGRRWQLQGTKGITRTSSELSGSLPLSELPWIFAETPSTPPGEYSLVGEGSVRTRADKAFVAVPAGFELVAGQNATYEEVGVIGQAENRNVFEVSGTIELRNLDGAFSCRVETGVGDFGDGVEYHLHGTVFDQSLDSATIYRGAPGLTAEGERSGGRRVPLEEIQWRSKMPGAVMGPYTTNTVGEGSIRHVKDGELRYSARVSIVPRDLQVTVDAGPPAGRLKVRGLQGASVALEDSAGCEVLDKDVDACCIHVPEPNGAPPDGVRVRLVWGGRASVDLLLPYPWRYAGFRGLDGSSLAVGSTVAVDQLTRYRAIAIAPGRHDAFWLEALFVADPRQARESQRLSIRLFKRRMSKSSVGVHEIELGEIASKIIRRFGADQHLDCRVQLQITDDESVGGSSTAVSVHRYDMVFDQDEQQRPKLDVSERERLHGQPLVVRAFPIWDPALADIELLAADQSWALPEETSAGGPWLVSGWQGNWCRVRPRIFHVGGQSPDLAEGTLGWASMRPFREVPGAISEVLAAMGSNAGNADWPLVFATIARCDLVPANAFLVLKELVRQPRTLAVAALLAVGQPMRQDLFWQTLETLPFSWRALPRDAWEHALHCWLTHQLAPYEAIDPEFATMMLEDKLNLSALRMLRERGFDWLIPVFEIVARDARKRPVSNDTLQLLSPARRAMFRITAEDAAFEEPHASAIEKDVPDFSLLGVHFVSAKAQLMLEMPLLDAERTMHHPRLAPITAALCAVLNVGIPPDAQSQLREVEAWAPHWFDEVYASMYRYAFHSLLTNSPIN